MAKELIDDELWSLIEPLLLARAPRNRRYAGRKRGITSLLAKVGSSHGSGLGKTRWVVERSIASLHSFRRLKIPYERYPHMHDAFLSLACSLICWNQLKPLLGN